MGTDLWSFHWSGGDKARICVALLPFRGSQASGGQSRIWPHGERRHHIPLYLPLGISSRNGAQEGQLLAAVWRFPAGQPGDRAWLLSAPKYVRFCGLVEQFFSKIDLRKGYWQVPVHANDITKTPTAVITPFGLFKFLHMEFCLRNVGSSFQRMMDRVISGLAFAFCNLDDLHVASHSPEEHITHLWILF